MTDSELLKWIIKSLLTDDQLDVRPPDEKTTLRHRGTKMNFKLEIKCDNAAFEPDARREISRILSRAASHLENPIDENTGILRDINGNRVGQWSLK